MAKDIFHWSQWSPHLGNAIAIATFVPTVIAGVAGLWAFLSPSGGLVVALIALAAFMMALWACIGMIWLRDRAARQDPHKIRKLLDCSWGLRVDGAFLNRDISESSGGEWQISVQIRNTLNWPLRVDIVQHDAVIENIISDQILENKIPFIALPNQSIGIYFPSYKKTVLPDKERFKGKINLNLRYGHPDGEYSRVMTRKVTFEQVIKPPIPEGFPGLLVPVSGIMPLNCSPYEEDRDEPYSSLR